MKDSADDKTLDLIHGESAVKDRVTDVIKQATEDAHLAAEHKLVAVRAYIRDEDKAEKLTNNAERQKRFLEKKKESGETKAFVPVAVAEAIKEKGSFEAWLQSQKIAPAVVEKEVPGPERIVEVIKEVPGPERIVELIKEVPGPERIVEVVKEVPAKLTTEQDRLIALGRSVAALSGWRRALINVFLG